MKADRDTQHIEELVLQRKQGAALRAIQAFLRKHRKSQDEALLQACDWLRRLGLHERGYRLLAPEEPLSRQASTERPEGRRVLWAARFLNLMGAPEFAGSLLSQVRPVSFDDHRILGSIYLANLEFAPARFHLERMRELDTDPTRYISRLSLLNLCDAYYGSGDSQRAIALAQEVQARSTEPLLQGIALTAQGEYWVRSGEAEEAVRVLDSASACFLPSDRSPDRGLLAKWLAYSQARIGRKAEAQAGFGEALDLLRGSSLRAEAWLDVLRLQAEVGLLDARTRTKLLRYPAITNHFRAELAELGEPIEEPALGHVRLEIDLKANEYREGDRRFLGVPMEIRVLAWLALAEDWGISVLRLKSMLWPQDVYAFLYLDSRLKQLLHRIRRYHGMRAELRDRIVSLNEDARAQIRVLAPSGGDGERLPAFLRERRQFTRPDLQKYYGLSSTAAWTYVQEWLKRGWVSEERQSRQAQYRRKDGQG